MHTISLVSPVNNSYRTPLHALRYGTAEEIEKRFNSGLTMAQKDHCLTYYPDTPARIEKLIDLVIWAANASRSLLETGRVHRVVCYGFGVE